MLSASLNKTFPSFFLPHCRQCCVSSLVFTLSQETNSVLLAWHTIHQINWNVMQMTWGRYICLDQYTSLLNINKDQIVRVIPNTRPISKQALGLYDNSLPVIFSVGGICWLRSKMSLYGKSVRSWCDGSLDRSLMVDPLSYFSFQPVLHDCGMCYPVGWCI